jgi:AraC-like DNA-binding protein
MQPTMVTTDMRYWRIAPDPRLAAHVVCYWMVESTAEGARHPADDSQSLMIPDGHAEIVLNRADAGFTRWKLDDPGSVDVMRRSYLIGGRSHSVSTRSLAPLKLAGVKLDPRFLHRLIGVPLDDFRDRTLTLRDLGHRALHDLEDAVANARDAATVMTSFDAFFLERLELAEARERAVDGLLRRIHDARGNLSIMRWAREAGVDARHLERRFCRGLGMTPKRYARVIRFKHAYRQLLAAGRGTAALAPHLGDYYDQSHFNREFRYFTGVAPRARLAGRVSEDFSVADHLLRGESS